MLTSYNIMRDLFLFFNIVAVYSPFVRVNVFGLLVLDYLYNITLAILELYALCLCVLYCTRLGFEGGLRVFENPVEFLIGTKKAGRRSLGSGLSLSVG